MKKTLFLIGMLAFHLTATSQVGIGTTSPNIKSVLDLSSVSKGLLIPRMSLTDRLNMGLAPTDAGMMVYQTTAPKGLYIYDGAWKYSSMAIGTATGQTLRWDNALGWVAESNIYNGGGSVGIGTGSNASEKLHIHSGGSDSRIHFTNGATSQSSTDGFFLGVLSTSGDAQLMHNEESPIVFGTNGIEQMRLDAAGNLGIHTTEPAAALDVNGSVKIGTNGTLVTGIIRGSVVIDFPAIVADGEWVYPVTVPNAGLTATVHVSPGQSLSQIAIGYARITSPGNMEIKFMNMAPGSNDPGVVTFYYTIIQ